MVSTARPDFSFGLWTRRLAHLARRGVSIIATLTFFTLIVLTASVVAMATAVAGILLATAAFAVRFVSNRRPAEAAGTASAASDPAMILNARRTSHGWTVE